jgi:bifunctional DNase/RNase
MIELKVEDVLARVSADIEDPLELPVSPTKLAWHGRIVLLAEEQGERVLPIWTGAFEGDLVAIGLNSLSPFRPMPYDLMHEIIRVTGARVESVAITSRRDNTYYATVSLAVDGRIEDVDARPSDALALAVRTGARVFADERVLDEEAVPSDVLIENLEAETRPGRWRSLRRPKQS